jgi:hypothetical protein
VSIKGKAIASVILMSLLSSTAFAFEEQIKSGYDLYRNIQLIDNPRSPEDLSKVLITTGFLMGFIDGAVLIQQVIYDSVFPREALSEGESKKMSEKLNLPRINFPESGLAVGQLMRIYKKYAEKHPEGLNMNARICIFEALIEAYGWK